MASLKKFRTQIYSRWSSTTKIIFWTPIILALLIFGMDLGIRIYDHYHLEPDLDVKIDKEVDWELGGIPIMVQNTGEKTLTGVKMLVRSCHMDKDKPYEVSDLEPGQNAVINFKDKTTLDNIHRIDCSYDTFNMSEHQIPLKIYQDMKTNEIMYASQESFFWGCASCSWNVTVISKEYAEDFYEELFTPIELSLEAIGKKIDFSDPNIRHLGTIYASVWDERSVEKLSVPA